MDGAGVRGPAPALTGEDRAAFLRAAQTMGDHRLAKRFGVSVTTANRYRRRFLGRRKPLPTNPDQMTATERRIVAACWGHVPPGDLAEAMGRCQRSVSELARHQLGLPAWERRATNTRRTPAKVQAYLRLVREDGLSLQEADAQCGWSAKTGHAARRAHAPELVRTVVTDRRRVTEKPAPAMGPRWRCACGSQVIGLNQPCACGRRRSA